MLFEIVRTACRDDIRTIGHYIRFRSVVEGGSHTAIRGFLSVCAPIAVVVFPIDVDIGISVGECSYTDHGGSASW